MTDQEDPRGDAPDRPGPAGWYVDPRDATRYRHWDGERWNELSSTVPLANEQPTAEAAAVRRRPRWPWLVGAVVVAALVAGTAIVALGGDDDGEDAATPTTTTTTTSPEPPTTATTPEEDAGTEPEPGETTAPPPSDPEAEPPPAGDPGPGPAPTVAVDPVAPCIVDGEVLLQKLREHPPLASFADRLSVSEVRCVGNWATAVTAASDTDESLAVFEASGDDWTLLLLGSSEPCAGLGIPEESQPLLRCGFPAP